jgi:hypothetical protein
MKLKEKHKSHWDVKESSSMCRVGPAGAMNDAQTSQGGIREAKLLQLLLWKMMHFALFLMKISINFRPGYSTLFFSITVDVSTLQKFQNFCTMF